MVIFERRGILSWDSSNPIHHDKVVPMRIGKSRFLIVPRAKEPKVVKAKSDETINKKSDETINNVYRMS
jgi:hypothetical protein